MASGRSSWRYGGRGLLRASDRIFDGIGARPLGIAVFAGSVALLVFLQTGAHGSFRAEAIAHAPGIDHPARVGSFVTKVYVRPGDRVDVGTPLVDLSPHFIDRELAQIGAEIETLLLESRLAQARLLVDEQRWLSPHLRPDRPSLEKPTEQLFEKSRAALQLRREQLLADRRGLTIRSGGEGRVVVVSAVGGSVAPGSSVATVSPEFAREIVAYVPPKTLPENIAIGAAVHIADAGRACQSGAEVLRRGGAIEEAPGQLRSLFRFAVHGMPVYVSIPQQCELAVGQVLTVEFARSVL